MSFWKSSSHGIPPSVAVLIVILVAAPVFAGGTPESVSAQEPLYQLGIRGHEFRVEIAGTPASRARGLMHRTELPERHGMLFVFPDDQYRAFWMKDTGIPLSIAYIDSDGVINEIHDMDPYSEIPVRSLQPARYELELNRNEFKRIGIRPGDRAILPPAAR